MLRPGYIVQPLKLTSFQTQNFPHMRKTSLLFLFLLTALPLAAQHKNTLYGTIIAGDTRDPVTGCSVILMKNGHSTVSDGNGNFSLSAPVASDTLIVRHIGYHTLHQAVTASSAPLTITLTPSVSNIRGVVVSTGYQDIPKERATGSFDFIDNKTFNEQAGPNVLNRLEAIANSFQYDRLTGTTAKTKIMIRGLNTINGPKDPLIVVDNFPYEGDLDNLNPNDVESITILKDAAAASIWGAKAGNGVIVIKMKKGTFNQPLKVQANVNLTLEPIMPDLFAPSRISTSDEIDVEEYLFKQGFKVSDTSSSQKTVLSPVYEILIDEQDGRISPQEAKAKIDALRKLDIRNDYLKYMYKPSVYQQYAVNVQGGSSKASWIFSTGYDKDLGLLGDGYSRINLRWANTYRPIKNLSIQSSIYYTLSDSHSGRPGYGSLSVNSSGRSGLYPYAQLATADGEPLAFPLNYRGKYTDTAGGGQLLDWKYYPLEDYKHSVTNTHKQEALINVGVNYKILDALTVDLKYQYESQTGLKKTLNDMQSYYTRNLINFFTNLNEEGRDRYPLPKGNIEDFSHTDVLAQSFRGQLDFHEKWGHSEVNAIAGGQVSETRTESSGNSLYGFDPANYTFVDVDPVNSYPTFITGRKGIIGGSDQLKALLNRFVSMYGNAAYTYLGKYTVTASARKDASNLLGVKTNNKWKPLWSTGVSWLISGEDFYHSSAVSYLKLRATFGYCGNVDPSRTAVTTVRFGGASEYVQTPTAVFNTYINPDLQWETFGQLNVGIDFEAFQRRLSGSLEYYHKNNSKLLGGVPIDFTTGIGVGIAKNSGNTKANGVDVTINSTNLQGKFSWTTNFNLSYNEEKISGHPAPTSDNDGAPTIGSAYNPTGKIGAPIYGFYSYKWAGLDPETGDPRGYVDGKVSEDYYTMTVLEKRSDLVFNGRALPNIFGNLGNTFSWRRWSLTARIMYKFGFYFFKSALSYSSLYYSWTTTGDFEKRWQKPGDEKHTNVPSMVYPLPSYRDQFYAGSEINAEKGGYIRLQYVTLSYQPRLSGNLSRTLKGLTLKASCSNLGILWRANKDGLDPEYQGGIPPTPVFNAGFNATF